MFQEAVVHKLAENSDVLVKRKKVGSGKSIRDKHVEDVWLLVCSIKNRMALPRVLLRNGKRSRSGFQQSRERTDMKQRDSDALVCPTPDLMSDCSISVTETECATPSSKQFPMDSVFRSTVLSDINSLKTKVSSIQRDVHQLQSSRMRACSNPTDGLGSVPSPTCWLYVRVKTSDPTSITSVRLESLLSSKIICCSQVRGGLNPAFKVKISVEDLYRALTLGAQNGCSVAAWRAPRGRKIPEASRVNVDGVGVEGGKRVASDLVIPVRKSLSVACWNCRGVSTSIPYIHKLMDGKPGLMVLSEHWLWPYELDKLNNISSDLAAMGKADIRLSAESDRSRGCGVVGILWHKSIGATPVDGILSDRVCAVQFSIDDGPRSMVSVIGVYLPCLDQGLECYRQHLHKLERVISESSLLGCVMVLGDFNAHLGLLDGGRGRGDPNLQGVMVNEVMAR